MSTVTATPAVLGLLNSLTDTTEILNAEGKVLGYFTPAAERERQAYERAKQSIDFAELERREKSGEVGHSFEQVLERLKSLEAAQCGSP